MTKVERLIKSIKASNTAFAKMSKPEKRVRVAKDVIAAINAGFADPVGGSYLQLNGGSLDFDDQSFQKTLEETTSCDVCAKGAIFVCSVLRQNKVTNGEACEFGTDNSSELIRGLFSQTQLNMIENYFEGDDIAGGSSFGLQPPHLQVLQHLSPKKRMITIMKNIIDNDGTFKPSLL